MTSDSPLSHTCRATHWIASESQKRIGNHNKPQRSELRRRIAKRSTVLIPVAARQTFANAKEEIYKDFRTDASHSRIVGAKPTEKAWSTFIHSYGTKQSGATIL